MFAIAHMALLARISLDTKDRNTTAAVSAMVNNIIGIIVGTLAAMFVVNLGWRLTGIILGALSGGLILITGLLVKETVGMTETGIDKAAIVPLKEQFKAVLKNRYFYLSLVLGMLVLLMNANAIGAQTFYCNVVLQEPMFMAQLMSIGLAPAVLVLFFMPFFANKFSKRALMIISCIILIIGFIVLGIAGKNHAVLILGTMIKALGIGSMFASLYAFVADAIDYGQWKTGIRSEGITAAASSIGTKLGMGFGAAITGWVLSAVGYNTAEAPSAAVISGITFDFSWLGVIISALLLICTLFMDVEKYLPEIRLAFEKAQASKLNGADAEVK
jgi:GPH family glycoside/pentoside/hexuronide:cation symporter